MILLSQFFLQKELQKSSFSRADLEKGLQKVQKGLGVSLGSMGIVSSRLRKLSFTTATGHARLITLLQTADGLFIPLLLRKKTDKIGKNMTPENQEFQEVLLKNYECIVQDIQENRFEIVV